MGEGHERKARRVNYGAGGDDPGRAIAIGKGAGERLHDAPHEILKRHGEAVDLAIPLMKVGDRAGEKSHRRSHAEGNNRNDATRDDDDARIVVPPLIGHSRRHGVYPSISSR